MGSSCGVIRETVEYWNAHGKKLGMVEVHLYRPVDKSRRFEGELLGLEDGVVRVMTAAGEKSFTLKEISLCKPLIEITEEDLELEDEAADLTADADEEGVEPDDGQE